MSIFEPILEILFVIIIGGSLVGTVAIILAIVRGSDDWFKEREYKRRKDWAVTQQNLPWLTPEGVQRQKDELDDLIAKQERLNSLNLTFQEPTA